MNKQIKYSYEGATQDITKSKHPFQYYFEGQHIRILSTDTQSTGSVTNEKGNERVITLPSIRIIGKQNIPVQAIDENVVVATAGTITIPILDNDIFLYPVTITIITPPTKGVLTINNTNTVTYINDDLSPGIDTIIYQIDDGFSTDTASITITVKEVIIKPDPNTEGGSEDSNYDGSFYYYKFAPCDRTLAFINIKSVSKISDNDVYRVAGSGGVGKEGKVAYKINPISTTWNIGGKYGTTCPPNLN